MNELVLTQCFPILVPRPLHVACGTVERQLQATSDGSWGRAWEVLRMRNSTSNNGNGAKMYTVPAYGYVDCMQ